MSITSLYMFAGLVIGIAICGATLLFLWWTDVRDKEKKAEKEKIDAYEQGFSEGYDLGGTMRFRERCQIARRCREIEKQMREVRNGQ